MNRRIKFFSTLLLTLLFSMAFTVIAYAYDFEICGHCNGTGYYHCPNCNDTGYVPCDHCQGQGTFYCEWCGGAGQATCYNCSGAGICGRGEGEHECEICNGTGIGPCFSCHGEGTVTCVQCSGLGKQKCIREDCPKAQEVGGKCPYCVGAGYIGSAFGRPTWMNNGVDNIPKPGDTIVISSTKFVTYTKEMAAEDSAKRASEQKALDKRRSEPYNPSYEERLAGQFGITVITTTAFPVDAVSGTKSGSYYKNSKGKRIKDSFVITSKGNTIYVNTKGKVVKSSIIASSVATSSAMTLYYIGSKGTMYKNKVITLPSGDKVFAHKDGHIAKDEFVTASSKRTYYATASFGFFINSTFTIGDKQYFADLEGVVAKKKIVTDESGVKHYATKDGSFATGKWVTVGDTKYYCDKSGIITKSKPAK